MTQSWAVQRGQREANMFQISSLLQAWSLINNCKWPYWREKTLKNTSKGKWKAGKMQCLLGPEGSEMTTTVIL